MTTRSPVLPMVMKVCGCRPGQEAGLRNDG